MYRKLLAFLVLLAAFPSVLAWSDYASQYFCDTAVRNVWGGKIYDECLGNLDASYQQSFCSGLSGSKQAECNRITETIHPAVLPNMVGEGELQTIGVCPIDRYPGKEYLCAKKDEAIGRARYFMNLSLRADNKCERVYMFCVATNYLAQTYDQFSMVLNEDDACKSRMYGRVDFDLRTNQTTWGASEVCMFSFNQGKMGGSVNSTQSQKMTVGDKTVRDILGNLSSEAKSVYTKPLARTSPTTTMPGISNEEKMYCSTDSDCVAVKSDCCDCSAGGKNTAVAKGYEGSWNAELAGKCKDTACIQVMSQHISCLSTPVCVNSECTLKPDTKTLCADQGIMANCNAETPTPVPGESAAYGVSCGYINYLCAPPVTTTTVTTTTIKITTTTVRKTPTTLPPTTIPTPTTTLPAKTETSPTLYIFAVVILVAGAYFVYAQMRAEAMKEGGKPVKGLRGLLGDSRKAGKAQQYRPSKLAYAGDQHPHGSRAPEHHHKKEADHDSRDSGREHETVNETKEQARKRRIKSTLQHQERETTTLGRR
ncbi:MAG: hypothetical protein V1744_04815 [Candidatus Altiarchaeota archaeon]